MARKAFYANRFKTTKGNIKQTWSVINEIFGKSRKTLPSYFIVNGQNIHDPHDIANSLQIIVINIGLNICNTSPVNNNVINYRDFLPQPCVTSLFLKPVNANEITTIVKSLKSTQSCGVDDFNPCVIKKIIGYISEPLIHIFNRSLCTGIIPSEMKIARVTPIYKKMMFII